MEVSSAGESTTSDTSAISITPPPPTTKPPPPGSLRRHGSGTSAITDADNNGVVEADNNGVVEAESRKLPSSRFKGVVPQPNGRWGAQIYEKHQRVWLGTFNKEVEAARAYDTAAQRFRGSDAVTNFKPLQEEDQSETLFLNSHSKAEIVDMLRKHTYNDELEQSRRSYEKTAPGSGAFNLSCGVGDTKVKAREHLFEKAVTPSDVGKLNRLVIPKQQAEKHFPRQTLNNSKGVLLNFEDRGGKVWRFRYSYWNSSQSYVLTKGWSRFVKEKNLRAGDIVSFQRSTGPDNKQLYIDYKGRNGGVATGLSGQIETVQMVRLFGVNISVDGSGSCGGKRIREMELLGLGSNKKQRVIDAL